MTSTVYVAKNVYGGDGLGRLGDGRVVFVPGAFAGENVRAEIVEERRNYVKARLVEIVEPSAARTGEGAPPIPGMVYANLEYSAEADAKEGQLREFLDRARLAPGSFGRMSGFGPSLAYRNKAVYHFDKGRDGRWLVGYRREPEHKIVDVESDPLVRPEINASLPEVRRAVNALLTQGPQVVRRDTERKGRVTLRWSAKSGVKWWVGDAPEGLVIRETTCGRAFDVPAGGFYQVNPAAADSLVSAAVAEYAAGAAGSPDILDLYCGVGVFGLCCRLSGAADGARLVGVESGRQAVDFARANAAAHGVKADFIASRVDGALRRLRVGPETTVIVDPPRGGLEPQVAAWLERSRAGRIVYVSCDPATLTRDLKRLCRAYGLESVKWIDMFPRTARFETLAVLVRREGGI